MHQVLDTLDLHGQVSALKEWDQGYEELESIPYSFVIELKDGLGSWSMFADSDEDKVRDIHHSSAVFSYAWFVGENHGIDISDSGLEGLLIPVWTESPLCIHDPYDRLFYVLFPYSVTCAYKSPLGLSHSMSSQYNPYQRGLSTGFSDAQSIGSAPLAHPVPHQAVGHFMGSTLGTGLETHEDGKIFALVIDLMDPGTREGALLELSKKREQYDDLALVLWHSFGRRLMVLGDVRDDWITSGSRNNASITSRNCFCVSFTFASQSDCPRLEPSLQCPGTFTVRGVAF